MAEIWHALQTQAKLVAFPMLQVASWGDCVVDWCISGVEVLSGWRYGSSQSVCFCAAYANHPVLYELPTLRLGGHIVANS